MMLPTKRAIQCVVEGDGDVSALPVLLEKLLKEKKIYDVKILRPKRRGEINVVERKLREILIEASHEESLILLVLDFDSKAHTCVVQSAKILESRFEEILPGYPAKVCFMVREFESLFLSDPASIQQVFQSCDLAKLPTDPERPRGCKECISESLPRGTSYKERIDQEKITAKLNLNVLRQKSSSFRHFEKTVDELLLALPKL